jgi:hypothetical protein
VQVGVEEGIGTRLPRAYKVVRASCTCSPDCKCSPRTADAVHMGGPSVVDQQSNATSYELLPNLPFEEHRPGNARSWSLA